MSNGGYAKRKPVVGKPRKPKSTAVRRTGSLKKNGPQDGVRANRSSK